MREIFDSRPERRPDVYADPDEAQDALYLVVLRRGVRSESGRSKKVDRRGGTLRALLGVGLH